MTELFSSLSFPFIFIVGIRIVRAIERVNKTILRNVIEYVLQLCKRDV